MENLKESKSIYSDHCTHRSRRYVGLNIYIFFTRMNEGVNNKPCANINIPPRFFIDYPQYIRMAGR